MGLACARAPGQTASQREGLLSRVSEGSAYDQPWGRHRRDGLGTRPLGQQQRIQLSSPGGTSGPGGARSHLLIAVPSVPCSCRRV